VEVTVRLFLALMLWLVISACSPQRHAAADPEELKKADLAFAKATAERGLDGFTAYLAGDAMTIRADVPVVKGAKALADRWAPLLRDPSQSITWQPLEARISQSGDLGFTVGTYQITKSEGQARSLVRSGKYVTIWRRQPSGEWKVAFDSGVQDSAPKPAP
jgi:ketosteroid isomerase-like protein